MCCSGNSSCSNRSISILTLAKRCPTLSCNSCAIEQNLLDQAFRETYGLQLKDVLLNENEAINSYRHDVGKLIPRATKIAWSLKQAEIKQDLPGMTRKKFLYNLSQSNYEREWSKDYRKPNGAEQFYALIYRLIPKIGPLRVLQFKTPTPETERMFEASFNASLDRYRKLLREVENGHPELPNDKFDVGEATGPGVYRLNDDTHARLLDELAARNFSGASHELHGELCRLEVPRRVHGRRKM